MSTVINTNASATLASGNLSSSNRMVQQSLARLSSGSRIVTPSDDAGGLAVSMKLSATAKRQAAVNSNLANAASFLSTQDGALKVAAGMLNRIAELKTLSVDRTKNASDIANYDTEFSQLRKSLIFITQEKFNGIDLFGSSDLSFNTTEDGDAFNAVRSQSINLLHSDVISSGWKTFYGGVAELDGFGVPTGIALMSPLNDELRAWETSKLYFSGAVQLQSSTGALWLSAANGRVDLSQFASSGNIAFADDGFAFSVSVNGGAVVKLPSITGSEPSNVSLSFGGNARVAGMYWEERGMGPFYAIATAGGLEELALSSVTDALSDVATYRAQNGAAQSRLAFASEMLTVNRSNLEQATSRITDVDVAQESTLLARANILVQAGTSMLSQANQSPQAALRLLQ